MTLKTELAKGRLVPEKKPDIKDKRSFVLECDEDVEWDPVDSRTTRNQEHQHPLHSQRTPTHPIDRYPF